MLSQKTVRDYIRTIVDFPHEGIMFRDVTTLFADPRGFRMAIDQMLHPYAGLRIDKVVGLEARGFILGGAIAHQLTVGFVPVRKKGKLPGPVISEEYTLEYGEAVVEVHDDAIEAGEKILLVDDLLATGGTAAAGIKLVERLGDNSYVYLQLPAGTSLIATTPGSSRVRPGDTLTVSTDSAAVHVFDAQGQAFERLGDDPRYRL